MSDSKPRLFLSYARDDDEPFVKKLYDDLVDQNFIVWWDRVSMPSRGLSFLQEIRDAIGSCDRLILVLGPDAIKSSYVRAEWEYALSLCKPVNSILRIGDYSSLPQELALPDAADFRDDGTYETTLSRFLNQLREPIPGFATLINVPPLLAWHLNREEHVEAVSKLLRIHAVEPVVSTYEHQSVTIWGLPGIGKSNFVAGIAHDCDIRRAFPDGIFWLELGKTPDLPGMQATIGIAFGDAIDHYANIPQGKARLARLMQKKAALIILDDVWDHKDVDAFRLTNEPRIKYLITTRNQGIADHIGGRIYELPPLTSPEGLGLVMNRLGDKINSEVDPVWLESIYRIVEVLAGHTQAISLAASQIRRRGLEFAPSLVNRIITRLRTHTPFQDINSPIDDDRSLNLDVCLSLTYEDLSDDLKHTFRVLGVFKSTGTFDALAVRDILTDMTSEPEDQKIEDVEDKLDLLVDAAMVVRHSGRRYSLPRVMKFYAASLLRNSDEFNDTMLWFVKYYLERAIDIFGQPPELWHLSSEEIPQINEAAEFCATSVAGTDSYPDVIRNLESIVQNGKPLDKIPEVILHAAEMFGLTLRTYVTFRVVGLGGTQGLCWLLAAMASAESRNRQESVANIAESIGDLYERSRMLPEALKFYNKAIDIWLSLGNKPEARSVVLRAGVIYKRVGRLSDVKDILVMVTESIESEGNEFQQGELWTAWGALHNELDEYEKAIEYDLRALTIWKNRGNKYMEAAVLNNLGMVYMRRGQFDEAIQYLNEALPLTTQIGDPRRQATCLLNLGTVFKSKGDEITAIEYFIVGVNLATAAGDPELASMLHHEIAFISWNQGDPDQAISAMLNAKAIKIVHNAPTEYEDKFLQEWGFDETGEAKG